MQKNQESYYGDHLIFLFHYSDKPSKVQQLHTQYTHYLLLLFSLFLMQNVFFILKK